MPDRQAVPGRVAPGDCSQGSHGAGSAGALGGVTPRATRPRRVGSTVPGSARGNDGRPRRSTEVALNEQSLPVAWWSHDEILREIGGGGMGIVYEAERVALRIRVALKVIHPRYRDRADHLRWFLREARAAADGGTDR